MGAQPIFYHLIQLSFNNSIHVPTFPLTCLRPWRLPRGYKVQTQTEQVLPFLLTVLFCQVVLQLKTNEPSSIGSPIKLHKVSSRSKYCVGLVVIILSSSYKHKCDRCSCLGCYIVFLQIKNKRIIRTKIQLLSSVNIA